MLRIFKDGSVVKASVNVPGKFVAQDKHGDFLIDDNNRMRYFASDEEAIGALPPTYQLPATVEVYQQAGNPVEVICPHCGRPITVYVQ